MRSTIFSTLLALIIASIVQAISLDRTLEIRQNTPVSNPPRFINDDGTIDIANLVAVSRIVPNNVPPTLPTNTTVNTSSSLNDVIQQAKAEQQIPQAAKRTLLDGCSTKINLPSTLGNLFVPQALTPSLFSGWPTFTSSANKANSTVANGNYTQVYKNVQATYLNPSVNSFLGMSTLWSYDVETCAARCTKLTGCMSFEIYYERDPSVDPTVSTLCSNPISITNIVCSYYGTPISSDFATSSGRTLGNFKIVKAGVDGYTLSQFVAPVIPGFSGAVRPGLVDNRISTGQGSTAGPQYASYTTYSIMYTSILTKNAYFDPIFCKAVADTYTGVKSFSTWPLTAGGDPNSTPFAGAGGHYMGQGCILYSVKGFPAETFNDVGQYGTDPSTGQNTFYSHAPNYHYDSLN